MHTAQKLLHCPPLGLTLGLFFCLLLSLAPPQAHASRQTKAIDTKLFQRELLSLLNKANENPAKWEAKLLKTAVNAIENEYAYVDELEFVVIHLLNHSKAFRAYVNEQFPMEIVVKWSKDEPNLLAAQTLVDAIIMDAKRFGLDIREKDTTGAKLTLILEVSNNGKFMNTKMLSISVQSLMRISDKQGALLGSWTEHKASVHVSADVAARTAIEKISARHTSQLLQGILKAFAAHQSKHTRK